MLVYLATPYTTNNVQLKYERMKKLEKIASALFELKVNFISPILHNYTLFDKGLIRDSSWDFWKNYCLSILEKCDKIFVFKDTDWKTSVGVQAEIKFAEENNIPVKYFTTIDDLRFLILY